MRIELKSKAFILFAILVFPVFRSSAKQQLEKITYLKFSDQKDNVLKEASNFAYLKSGVKMELPSNRFMICGSIFIRYFRSSFQTFYTMRRNDHRTLWFSLSVAQDLLSETYLIYFWYIGKVLVSKTRLNLRPHAWSHACTSVDMDTGQVLVVFNGIVTHDKIINSKDFRDNIPLVFAKNLFLGAHQDKFKGSPDIIEQSEASVTNLNIFSVPSNVSEMIQLTLRSQCSSGDVLSWSDAAWSLTGSVESMTTNEFCDNPYFHHLFLLAKTFGIFKDCANLCPRLQAEGRIPQTSSVTESVLLAKQFKNMAHDYKYDKAIWAPFVFRSVGNFSDFYSRNDILTTDMWVPGQPYGGETQQCSGWKGTSDLGNLFDLRCSDRN